MKRALLVLALVIGAAVARAEESSPKTFPPAEAERDAPGTEKFLVVAPVSSRATVFELVPSRKDAKLVKRLELEGLAAPRLLFDEAREVAPDLFVVPGRESQLLHIDARTWSVKSLLRCSKLRVVAGTAERAWLETDQGLRVLDRKTLEVAPRAGFKLVEPVWPGAWDANPLFWIVETGKREGAILDVQADKLLEGRFELPAEGRAWPAFALSHDRRFVAGVDVPTLDPSELEKLAEKEDGEPRLRALPARLRIFELGAKVVDVPIRMGFRRVDGALECPDLTLLFDPDGRLEAFTWKTTTGAKDAGDPTDHEVEAIVVDPRSGEVVRRITGEESVEVATRHLKVKRFEGWYGFETARDFVSARGHNVGTASSITWRFSADRKRFVLAFLARDGKSHLFHGDLEKNELTELALPEGVRADQVDVVSCVRVS